MGTPAHTICLPGGQGVAGSNPVSPTREVAGERRFRRNPGPPFPSLPGRRPATSSDLKPRRSTAVRAVSSPGGRERHRSTRSTGDRAGRGGASCATTALLMKLPAHQLIRRCSARGLCSTLRCPASRRRIAPPGTAGGLVMLALRVAVLPYSRYSFMSGRAKLRLAARQPHARGWLG